MNEDAELLRNYVEDKSQDAFAELVRRHLPMVYGCAHRRVGNDSHLAADVTQSVFGALARKAAALRSHRSISGWLYVSAHHAAAECVRAERRRKERESESILMAPTTPSPAEKIDFTELRPLVDQSILQLGNSEREAVVLRFFEQRSFPEIAAALRVSEAAARKRVERAVEKLRAHLARQGITSTTAALTVGLASQGVVAVPAALATEVTASALAGAAATGAGTSSVSWLIGGLSAKSGAIPALILAGLPLAWQSMVNHRLRDEVHSLRPAKDQLQALTEENRKLAQRVAEAEFRRKRILENTSSPLKAAAPAPLPPPRREPATPPKTIMVSAQGTVRWENQPVTIDGLLQQLVSLQAANPTAPPPLLVRAAPGGSFSAMAFVVEQASRAGVKNIEIDSTAVPNAADNWITTKAPIVGPQEKRPPTIPDSKSTP